MIHLTALVTAFLLAPALPRGTERVRHIEYSDLPAAIQKGFAAEGIPEQMFAGFLHRLEAETERRVDEGEREHFIYYALQSNRFTKRPGIEPAVSAHRFVQGLTGTDRQRFLADAAYLPPGGWPAAERTRVADALAALAGKTADARLSSFRELRTAAGASLSVDALYPDYVRIARFLYQKEFAAGGSAGEIAPLYQSRAHSSDTQIEAGFGVYLGLGAVHALEPALAIHRVLVVGPGLDVAPRTDLIDLVGPQMYQPFAVADALLGLSISAEADLRIHSVDVNPRVVRFAQMMSHEPVTLHLFTGLTETAEQRFSTEYRDYVRALGRAIGDVTAPPAALASDRRYQHSITVRPAVRRAMSAERLNILTDRLLDGGGFDLVVITNVFTYFDGRELALALSNIGAMLRPGGYLLHNESRAGLVETSASLHLPPVHMRTAVLGGPADRPWYDTVWLHQKART
jgi:hypothetical protein